MVSVKHINLCDCLTSDIAKLLVKFSMKSLKITLPIYTSFYTRRILCPVELLKDYFRHFLKNLCLFNS